MTSTVAKGGHRGPPPLRWQTAPLLWLTSVSRGWSGAEQVRGDWGFTAACTYTIMTWQLRGSSFTPKPLFEGAWDFRGDHHLYTTAVSIEFEMAWRLGWAGHPVEVQCLQYGTRFKLLALIKQYEVAAVNNRSIIQKTYNKSADNSLQHSNKQNN